MVFSAPGLCAGRNKYWKPLGSRSLGDWKCRQFNHNGNRSHMIRHVRMKVIVFMRFARFNMMKMIWNLNCWSGSHSQWPVFVWAPHPEGLANSGSANNDIWCQIFLWQMQQFEDWYHSTHFAEYLNKVCTSHALQDALLSLGLTSPSLFVSWLFHDSDQVCWVVWKKNQFHFLPFQSYTPVMAGPVAAFDSSSYYKVSQLPVSK